jgi:hypothetical protein
MRAVNLQLTATGDRFSLTPLPPQVVAHCTGAQNCQELASHRLLSSQAAAGVELLCNDHALAWAQDQGIRITTARLDDSSAA